MNIRFLLDRPVRRLLAHHCSLVTSRSFFTCRVTSEMAPPLAVVPCFGQGRVLSIQSHTVQGYVGNKAAVFPLQLLGFDVDPINSVQFSNHTGYPVCRGQVLNGDELWSLIEGLEANGLLYYTHLLTVCDPVMGDEGTFYIPQNLVPVYAEKVLQLASIVTPNQFEAEKLTGCSIKSELDALQACKVLHMAGPSKVIITSLEMNGRLLLIGSCMKSKGTGDLMTALLLGWSHKYPDDLERAAELAVSSLQSVLKRTVSDYLTAEIKPDVKQLELRLIQSQDDIKSPKITHLAERYS